MNMNVNMYSIVSIRAYNIPPSVNVCVCALTMSETKQVFFCVCLSIWPQETLWCDNITDDNDEKFSRITSLAYQEKSYFNGTRFSVDFEWEYFSFVASFNWIVFMFNVRFVQLHIFRLKSISIFSTIWICLLSDKLWDD